MKKSLLFFVLFLIFYFVNAQPCKKVKIGMLKSEVLILVGKPSEIDTIGSEVNTSNSKKIMVVWQYGNQRVSFKGNKVDGVIADGKKYDQLLVSYNHGEFPKKELPERLKKLNDESCK